MPDPPVRRAPPNVNPEVDAVAANELVNAPVLVTVGRVTVPVKVGEASGDFRARSLVKLVTPDSGRPVPFVRVTDVGVPRIGVTKLVLAGTVTVPVKVGEAMGAHSVQRGRLVKAEPFSAGRFPNNLVASIEVTAEIVPGAMKVEGIDRVGVVVEPSLLI